MSQLGFIIQRDNEWRVVYAGRKADVYMNPATVTGWIQNRWWAERMRGMECDNEAVWIEYFSLQYQKQASKQKVTSKMAYLKV